MYCTETLFNLIKGSCVPSIVLGSSWGILNLYMKKGAYELTHAGLNLALTPAFSHAFLTYMQNPTAAATIPASTTPIYWIFGLHLIHLPFTIHKKDKELMIHHIVALLQSYAIVYWNESTLGIHSLLLFMNGLPGAISYLTLVAYWNGVIKKRTQRSICEFVDMYIRSPGIAMTVGSMFIQAAQHGWKGYLAAFILVSTALINGQYFMKQTILSNFKLLSEEKNI